MGLRSGWRLGKTNKGPGIFRPLLAETAESGIAAVLNELERFYSIYTSSRGLRFEKAKKSIPLRQRSLWINNVYNSDNSLYAKVRVYHSAVSWDDNPPPGKPQQLYLIYFNVLGDVHSVIRLSMKERDDFFGYLERQNV